MKAKEDYYCRELKKITQEILDKKKAEFNKNKLKEADVTEKSIQNQPLMDHLLELLEDGQISDDEVYDEVNTFLSGASDTLSISLPLALMCLGSHCDVQKKIVDELNSVFGNSDRDIEKEDLSKLKYMDAVIKEIFRLYPTIPLIGRCLEKDLQLKNYTIPANSKCYIILYAVLRHPTWGVDADQFRPERWLDGSVPTSLRTLVAFGIGKRRCIGTNFAIMVMKTYLCQILRSYAVTSDISKMRQLYQVTSRPVHSHHISIELRDGRTKSQ